MADAQVLEGYAADAAELVPQFEALATLEVLAPVAAYLPVRPCRVLEVGAGTGRDAAWFAERGHRVLAVEPVRELREAGMALHRARGLDWMDDRLPELARVHAIGQDYDFILAVAVWQHLPPHRHRQAVAALAGLTAPRGRIILSLRHGPGLPAHPCFPIDPDRIAAFAQADGLRLAMSREAESIQQKNRDAGVTSTWLCLERP